MKLKRKIISLLLFFSLFFLHSESVATLKKGNALNPLTEIDWSGIFPIKVGGVTTRSSDIPTVEENIDSPVCLCGVKTGIKTSFWEPARMEETVKDAHFFPSIGIQIDAPGKALLDGGTRKSVAGEGTSSSIKVQNHHFVFPAFAIMGLFLDFPCFKEKSLDIGYVSEVDPTHNNCLLSFIVNPEAILFGNPVASLACAADSVAANTPSSVLLKASDYLFWCVGSWGIVYPLCGTVSADNQIEANALLAAKMIFKLGRIAALLDVGKDYCNSVLSLIWTKTNYRLQLAKPVRGRAMPIGRSSLIWGAGKNPPYGAGGNLSDNFLWMIFRHNKCCVFAY